MAHQSRTIELRNWFVDGDCDLDLNPCYVIKHLLGPEETCYGNHDNFIMDFYNRDEAEAFAKKLNEQAVPETYTYSEWSMNHVPRLLGPRSGRSHHQARHSEGGRVGSHGPQRAVWQQGMDRERGASDHPGYSFLAAARVI